MQKGREFLGEKCKRFLVRASTSALQPKLTILPHDDDDYVISNYVDYQDDDDDDDIYIMVECISVSLSQK